MELNEEQFDRLTDTVVERIEQRMPAVLTSVPGGGAAGVGGSSAVTTAAPILYVPPEFWEAQVEFRKDIAAIRIQMAVFQERFEAIDKRFEAVDKRFEAVDKRFDDLIHFIDKRFDSVDKRFSALQWFMGIGFSLIVALMSLYNFAA